jgi:hypothetical protein
MKFALVISNNMHYKVPIAKDFKALDDKRMVFYKLLELSLAFFIKSPHLHKKSIPFIMKPEYLKRLKFNKIRPYR